MECSFLTVKVYWSKYIGDHVEDKPVRVFEKRLNFFANRLKCFQWLQ